MSRLLSLTVAFSLGAALATVAFRSDLVAAKNRDVVCIETLQEYASERARRGYVTLRAIRDPESLEGQQAIQMFRDDLAGSIREIDALLEPKFEEAGLLQENRDVLEYARRSAIEELENW
ncbi:MAG: hypothetical protein AAF662_05850 [Pseudomonadota bacterium]